MVDSAVLKSLFVVIMFLVILCGNINLLRRFRSSDELEKSLRRIIKLLVISGFLSDVINLVSLLISTSSGNIFTCQKVQVGKDQEKAQSEKDSHSKNRGGKKPN